MTRRAEAAGAKALGRDFLKGEDRLCVRRFRDRLLGPLGLEKGAGRRALDLGCGDGLVTVALAEQGWQALGLDLEPHAAWPGLARAQGSRLRFRALPVERLKAPGPGFDLVFEKDMLHHAADPVAMLRRMARLTRRGGRLLALEANRLNPVFYVHLTLMEGHQHFTRRRLLQLFSLAGLEGAVLSRREARVWPWDSPWVQDAADAAQDLAEALPFLRPWLCYHAVSWVKP